MITSERMAAVDRNAEALGVPRKQLMESSGNAVARLIRDVAAPGSRVAIVAGRGNNGGDGFVAARFLPEFDVSVHLLGRPETIRTRIARENWDALVESGYETETVGDSREFSLPDCDVVVDAMLGTGITGALREPERTAAEAMNDADATVVAVDVPSGFDAAGTESARETEAETVSADHVVTFHDTKPGLDGLEAELTVADIGIPAAAERVVGPGDLGVLTRNPDARKGDAGRVLVIGGGPYTGAPALCAQASLRVGADLAFVAVPTSIFEPLAGYAEDLIVQPYEAPRLGPEQVDDLLETATKYDDIVVLGPGLGGADETVEAARRFLDDFEGRAVVDADALAAVPEIETEATLICTPNRKELAELGGPDPDAGPIRDLTEEVEDLAADLGHVVVAKERVDVVSDGERTRLCRTGTPGMTVGGTGDVLAGATAGLFGTHDAFDAACLGTYVNGRAGELLAAERGDGLLASDLLEALPEALRPDS